jgi:malonyl-CoA decarboxylase
LGNGAVVHAVHADADVSDKGKAQSGGTMVNYHYDLGKIAQNHEKLATTKEVAATAEVKALAASSPLPLLQER